MKTALLLILTVLTGMSVVAQPQNSPDANGILSGYIRQALDSNLVLQQKQLDLKNGMLALQEARSYYLPSISGLGNYTLAQGGRQIAIPVGDLLNPVYSTLNQLTSSTRFPQISNVNEQFFPNNFYDVRVRTTYPILNPEIKYNRDIKAEQLNLTKADIAIYRRELIRDVKVAYYKYLLATQASRIYESTLGLVERGLKVNESLFANGKGLPAYISRSKAEVEQVYAQLKSAQNDAMRAKAYFNFLLNRPLTDTIVTEALQVPSESLPGADDALAASRREELQQITTAANLYKLEVKMGEQFKTPRISSFLDAGAQAFDFALDKNAPYLLFGIQAEVPIFQGKRNLYKIAQSKNNLAKTQLQHQQVSRQVELAAFSARTNVQTALWNYEAAQKQLVAAQSYFKLIDRGRTEGTNTFIEWLDARNQLTTAEIQVQINLCNILTTLAEYEREAATESIIP